MFWLKWGKGALLSSAASCIPETQILPRIHKVNQTQPTLFGHTKEETRHTHQSTREDLLTDVYLFI